MGCKASLDLHVKYYQQPGITFFTYRFLFGARYKTITIYTYTTYIYVVTNMDVLEELYTIVEERSCRDITLAYDGKKKNYIVDLFTAGVMVQCYEALSPEGKKKYADKLNSRDFVWFERIRGACFSCMVR